MTETGYVARMMGRLESTDPNYMKLVAAAHEQALEQKEAEAKKLLEEVNDAKTLQFGLWVRILLLENNDIFFAKDNFANIVNMGVARKLETGEDGIEHEVVDGILSVFPVPSFMKYETAIIGDESHHPTLRTVFTLAETSVEDREVTSLDMRHLLDFVNYIRPTNAVTQNSHYDDIIFVINDKHYNMLVNMNNETASLYLDTAEYGTDVEPIIREDSIAEVLLFLLSL